MNIDSSYINAYNINSVNSSSIEKLSSGLAINKASDDASGLVIADSLGIHKSSIAQSLDNSMSGIALSNIAQGAVQYQKNILEDIKQETLKAMNGTMSNDDREAIAQKISQSIKQYEQIANTTTYNGEKLLQTTGEASDDLSIVGEDSIISISKADTTSISDSLKAFMGDFTTNPDSREQLLSAVDIGINQLASFASEYGSSSNALESMARNFLSQETNTAKAQSVIKDIDYSKEVTNFSKSNLLTQIGYLMQTQANAHQQRNIALLS